MIPRSILEFIERAIPMVAYRMPERMERTAWEWTVKVYWEGHIIRVDLWRSTEPQQEVKT